MFLYKRSRCKYEYTVCEFASVCLPCMESQAGQAARAEEWLWRLKGAGGLPRLGEGQPEVLAGVVCCLNYNQTKSVRKEAGLNMLATVRFTKIFAKSVWRAASW